ncbi:hypothetical protein KR018_003133 [Drosophila ironensis]|nr:hypothetical protein KR018_003133 [Drosophila ironensis]
MKAGRAFGCLFWALLYCVLYLDLVSANSMDDELLDFDFADTKGPQGGQDDWQLDDLEDQQALQTEQAEKKLESNMLDFSVDLDEPEPERQVPTFDWRERALRSALAKALADEGLRQKFVEVMPILRVLSRQQRLALSALISAQMNAKKGHDLKLEQVRMMFGNDKKLLLPIVFDLANLVKSSTRKYINFGSDLAAAALFGRREDQLTTDETEQDNEVGTISVNAEPNEKPEKQSDDLQDFFEEVQSEVLDPQMINEALQSDLHNDTQTAAQPPNHGQRVRRSANEFIHKLPRSVPASVSEQQLLGGIAGRTVKLNTTAFQQPSGSANAEQGEVPSTAQSYVEIEDLAFAGLNGTEVPLSADERLDLQRNSGEEQPEEPLPSPEELIAGPRYRLGKRPPGQKSVPPIKRKRVQGVSSRGRPKTAASSHKPVVTSGHKKCERFTSSMCIRTDDYPLDQIMGSIRRHKNAMSALLAEFYDRPNNNLEFGDDFDDFSLSKKRREDEGSAGGMCQSVVRYARPQKAKSASGEWKYIVNTGQHTQTLRLEKCSNPGESCSYLAQTYRSHCSQVYNYHRLLSWDKVRGLHVDIFKVPTCCSCQVDGYRQQFPPLSSIQAKDYSPLVTTSNGNNNGYSTINEEDLDYAEENDEDELGLGLRYPTFNNRETNELYASSKKVRVKVPGVSTSVGPYLSPPDDDDDDRYGAGAYKGSSSQSTSHKKYYSQLGRRRPQHSEARLDLDLAPSETHADQEVNLFAGPPEKQRAPLNRMRIYASTHTAPTTSATSVSAPASASVPSPHGGGSSAARLPVRFPQTTSLPARTGTAAAAVSSSFSFSPGASVGPASVPAHATHAHQAGAAAIATAAPSQPGGQRSRPRFYAPPAPPAAAASPTTTFPVQQMVAGAAPTLSTEHTTQWERERDQSTAPPQPQPQPPAVYPVGTIFASGGSSEASGKRINYNYHPIIDFFEKNRKAESQDVAEESRVVEQRVFPENKGTRKSMSMGIGMGGGMETITGVYQHPIPIPTTHERRMGYGAGGAGGGMGGAGAVGRVGGLGDNAWQPMVME